MTAEESAAYEPVPMTPMDETGALADPLTVAIAHAFEVHDLDAVEAQDGDMLRGLARLAGSVLSDYLVFKAPECKVKGRGHGRHTLMTRSAMCPGEEPMPHGYAHFHMGTFGPWIKCRCGREFSDYHFDPENAEPTNWQAHKTEHGITDE